MTDIVKGMARCFEIASDTGTYDEEAMRGALLWWANYAEREAGRSTPVKLPGGHVIPSNMLIAAAIRAAAGEEG